MGILAVLAKLLTLAWTALKLMSLLPLKGVILGLALLWKTKLWILAVFFVGILPEILGTYSFLIGEDLEWYFAIPSAIGIQFGGAIFDILTGIQELAGSTEFHGAVLLVGIFLSITSLFWYFYFWHLANRFVEGDNLSSLWILGIGGLLFTACLLFALVVDQYVLADEAIRVSGITYFVEDPGAALDPLDQWLGEAAETAGNGNHTDPINSTNNNNSIGDLE